MEWTGEQQVLFLLQSAGLGFGIGIVFEFFTGVGRCVRRRWCRFVLDALFGIPAALVTFFGALVIMDGQLHPLLFAGCVVGFIAEHGSIGRWIATATYTCVRFLRRGLTLCGRVEAHIWPVVASFLRAKRAKRENTSKKSTKRQKN